MFIKNSRLDEIYSCRPRASHQQCDVNYREIRRATVWSYKFHRRIDGCVPPAELTRPYEKLPIPTDLALAHITLLVVVPLSEPSLHDRHLCYRGTSPIRNCLLLGPYSRPVPRTLPRVSSRAASPDLRQCFHIATSTHLLCKVNGSRGVSA